MNRCIGSSHCNSYVDLSIDASTRSRKQLSIEASKFNLVSYTNVGAKEAFGNYLLREWKKLERLMEGSHEEKEIASALKNVQDIISILNDELRRERLEAMEKMSYQDAFADYLSTQCVTGYRIGVDKDHYVLDTNAEIGIDAYDVLTALCGADLEGILDACCIFADNVARYMVNDSTAVSRRSTQTSYLELRVRNGWDIPKAKLSKTKLAEQLTEVCKMMSGGVCQRMSSSDVGFIMVSVVHLNNAGKIIQRNDRTIVRFIFRAMYTRYHHLSYGFQNNTQLN